jgi:hypothetical protein
MHLIIVTSCECSFIGSVRTHSNKSRVCLGELATVGKVCFGALATAGEVFFSEVTHMLPPARNIIAFWFGSILRLIIEIS